MTIIGVKVDRDFNLEKAVCNHGYFMMAPNQWIPDQKSLLRPLRLIDQTTSVTVSISQPRNRQLLRVQVLGSHKLSSQDQQAIKDQVARMLRISAKDEMMVRELQKIHPRAKMIGFGRLFRSPTLFEDIVKSFILCYSTWSRSLRMAQSLCDLKQKLSFKKKLQPKKRKHECSNQNEEEDYNNFPSVKEIACLDETTLTDDCKLGYRAEIVLQFARDVESGKLNLRDLETITDPHLLHQKLRKLKGVGPFTAANVMMCMGFYQYVPVDTETVKHLEQVHGRKTNKETLEEDIEQIYGKYAPFQGLVYWMELIECYEQKLGKLSELQRSQYCKVITSPTRQQ